MADAEIRVVEVVGRWARLANGELVTPIPPFSAHKDAAAFDAAIAAFQADPAGALLAGIVERTGSKKAKA